MSAWGRLSQVKIDPRNPVASAVCDRCDRRFNKPELGWQWDWAGNAMINKHWLVCDDCLDQPSMRYRVIELRADPEPVMDARPRNWAAAETDYIVNESGVTLTDENGNPLTRD